MLFRSMGGGEANDINFKSGEQTEFTFPFSLKYKSSDDPGNQVFIDLGTKCGLGGGARSDITVKYKITVCYHLFCCACLPTDEYHFSFFSKLGIRFLLVVISPVIENSFKFACPSSITGGVSVFVNFLWITAKVHSSTEHSIGDNGVIDGCIVRR